MWLPTRVAFRGRTGSLARGVGDRRLGVLVGIGGDVRGGQGWRVCRGWAGRRCAEAGRVGGVPRLGPGSYGGLFLRGSVHVW